MTPRKGGIGADLTESRVHLPLLGEWPARSTPGGDAARPPEQSSRDGAAGVVRVSPCGCGEGSIGTVIGINVKELADLTMAIAAINAGNRMAISFRDLPGDYQPG